MASVRHLGLFPFCVQDDLFSDLGFSIWQAKFDGGLSFDPPTQYPSLLQNLTLQQVMTFFWRVKAWKFSAACSYTVTYEGGSFSGSSSGEEIYYNSEQLDFVPDGNFALYRQKENAVPETVLVCPEGPIFYNVEQEFYLSPQFDMRFTGPNGTGPIVKIINEESYGIKGLWRVKNQPSVSEYFSTQGASPAAISTGDTVDSTDQFRSPVVPTTLIWKWAGAQLSMSYAARVFPDLTPMPEGINNFSVSVDSISEMVIEAHEYWPYDPEDGGGPIYDSTTGARIRYNV